MVTLTQKLKAAKYLWYCPTTNEIRLMPFGECRETPECRWDKCFFVTSADMKAKFFYIGEL